MTTGSDPAKLSPERPTPERLRELIEFLCGRHELDAQQATAACRDAAAALRRLLVLEQAIDNVFKDWGAVLGVQCMDRFRSMLEKEVKFLSNSKQDERCPSCNQPSPYGRQCEGCDTYTEHQQ